MWCKAPSRPPLSPANMCGTVPRLSRGRGRQIIMSEEKEKGKQMMLIRPEKRECREQKRQKIAGKRVCSFFVAVINATPKGEK